MDNLFPFAFIVNIPHHILKFRNHKIYQKISHNKHSCNEINRLNVMYLWAYMNLVHAKTTNYIFFYSYLPINYSVPPSISFHKVLLSVCISILLLFFSNYKIHSFYCTTYICFYMWTNVCVLSLYESLFLENVCPFKINKRNAKEENRVEESCCIEKRRLAYKNDL